MAARAEIPEHADHEPVLRGRPRGGAAACRRMDDALRHGRLGPARRLLRPVARLVRGRPRLAERLAQRAIAAGDPGLGLAVADACSRSTEALRALRRLCLAELDRPAPAACLRRDDEAEALRLAARQLAAGATCAARRTVRHLLRSNASTLTLMTGIALDASRGDRAAAGRLARRLAGAPVDELDEAARLMIGSLGLHREAGRAAPRLAAPAAPPLRSVRLLARELVGRESVIGALAAGLARGDEPEPVALLAAAVEHALPSLAAPVPAAEAMASLLLAHGEPAAARVWAQRALRSNPFAAAAARLLHECNRRLYTLGPRVDGGREAA